MINNSDKKRVAVIGAGIAGIAALRVFSETNQFDITVFERTKAIGGVWNYIENSDNVKYTTPMYRDLKSNLPKEVMYFPDMMYPESVTESFITHKTVMDYVNDYMEKYDLLRCIEFDSLVESVERVDLEHGKHLWKVTVTNTESSESSVYEFDGVIVCVGNFEVPRIPNITDIHKFKGCVSLNGQDKENSVHNSIIRHSKLYRTPEEYAGKIVCVLGARSSGMDIALQLTAQAEKVYLCHNRPHIPWKYPPSNLIQRAGIERITEDGKIKTLENIFQSSDTFYADCIVYCTGYDMNLDFLTPTCQLTYEDRYLGPLFEHVASAHYPDSMYVVGLGFEITPFLHFYLQSKFALACFSNQLSSEIAPKSKEEFLVRALKFEEDSVKNNIPLGRRHHFGSENEFKYLGRLEKMSEKVITAPIPKHLELMFSMVKKWRLNHTELYRVARLKLSDKNHLGFELILPKLTPGMDRYEIRKNIFSEFEEDMQYLLETGLIKDANFDY